MAFWDKMTDWLTTDSKKTSLQLHKLDFLSLITKCHRLINQKLAPTAQRLKQVPLLRAFFSWDLSHNAQKFHSGGREHRHPSVTVVHRFFCHPQRHLSGNSGSDQSSPTKPRLSRISSSREKTIEIQRSGTH